MPFALGVKSVNASAGAIVSLWDRLSVFEDSPSMRALNYPPHITFAIYDAPEVTGAIAIAAMERAAQGRTAIEITFNRIRTFDGPSLILWADPEPKEMLLDIHPKIHSAINPGFCRPHYRPGNWVPHCTLATRIVAERNADALAFAATFRGDIRVTFDVIDCVALQPLKVVAEAPLNAPGI
jgi:2'-5' RNA ligase